jgi:hypothetical protein
MKPLTPSASPLMLLVKTGLVIAIATGLAPVQAATDAPAPAPTGAASQGAAAKAGTHKHKEVTLAPVRPQSYPSNPLPPVPTPKQKP